MNRRGSVQQVHLRFQEVEDDVLWLSPGVAVGVLEVGSLNLSLQGETEREQSIGGFSAFLNALDFPVQILVRVQPVDIHGYLVDLERRAVHLPERLARLAEDHMSFLRRMARERTLLDRRFYVVILEGQEPASPVRWPLARKPAQVEDASGAARRLAAHCDEVQGHLQRCGLPARRLALLELVQLYYSCWCPELARVQRLQQQLGDLTAPVVTGRHGSGGEA